MINITKLTKSVEELCVYRYLIRHGIEYSSQKYNRRYKKAMGIYLKSISPLLSFLTDVYSTDDDVDIIDMYDYNGYMYFISSKIMDGKIYPFRIDEYDGSIHFYGDNEALEIRPNVTKEIITSFNIYHHNTNDPFPDIHKIENVSLEFIKNALYIDKVIAYILAYNITFGIMDIKKFDYYTLTDVIGTLKLFY